MKCHYEVLEAPRYVRREFKPPDGVSKRGRANESENKLFKQSDSKDLMTGTVMLIS